MPRTLRILVVDDDRDTGDILGELLREDGFNVCVAQGAEQAIEAAPTFRPEVVILELVMPGTDGFTAAERLQRLPSCQGTTYVAYSGLYTPRVLEKCKALEIQHSSSGRRASQVSWTFSATSCRSEPR